MMDKVLVTPRLSGAVRAPSSKSEAHRALMAAALSHLYGANSDTHRILCPDSNEDIEATVRCLCALGADIARDGDYLTVTPITAVPPNAVLDCGESGSTLRFLLPVACALGTEQISFACHGRLSERPLSPLREELTAHGARISPVGSNPLVVQGNLSAGDYRISGGVSSQFVSGLLFALPLLDGDSRLSVTEKTESAPYIHMTLDAVSAVTPAVGGTFSNWTVTGRKTDRAVPRTSAVSVGGDWSAAAFWLTAGVMGKSSVTVTGLDSCTRQGDCAIVDILRRMGGRIDYVNGALTAYGSTLRGCEVDASQIPDLVPILAVAASVAEGDTRIVNASRLRLKESDRLATVSAMITALGGDITETSDGLIVRGLPALRGGTVDSAGDHRIAMSAAVAATRCAGAVTVKGAETVAKSYPCFWDDFNMLNTK